jgi:hypothetical protein
MLKENKHRSGINDRPLTHDEFERMRAGDPLYKHKVAPKRPANGSDNRKKKKIAVI